ncbi:flavin reductase family protein [Bacteroides sp.]|uniref:flavin reductase family protein n=1 Tax=Bacteroides sp. TaxID=29523 RepID=UPI00261F3FA2|nr:flavin reductase family protein [Bacteroides sp.]
MMKPIAIKDLNENFFQTIGKEWMLVTAGDKEQFNTMTASWGSIGFLWNKPVVFVFIRPERYTFEFIEKSEYFTLSFLGEENKAIHKICGSKSGREVDKVKETGLKPIITEKGNIFFEQGRLNLECRKLYSDTIKEECFIELEACKQWYGGVHGGFHHMYIAEITGAWIKE